ncbi:MAG: fatty acid synthase, partial [Myxococcota bacterium]
ARTLLIELLAWQFASPVRWIETQDLLLSKAERFVEIGVAHAPTVANMMRSTIKSRPHRIGAPTVLNAEADFDALLGPAAPVEIEKKPVPAAPPVAVSEAGPVLEAAPAAAAPTAAAPTTTAPTTTAPTTTLPTASGARLDDVAVSAGDALRTVIAMQGRLRLDQVGDTETLDEVLGGNSARRNQVMADLGAELGSAGLDGAHEIPLGDVARAVEQRGGYAGHGGYLAEAVDATLERFVGPARLNRASLGAYLEDEWSLGEGHRFRVINRVALAARSGRSTRGGDLSLTPAAGVSDNANGLAWVDQVVQAYGQELGAAISKAAPESAAAGATVDAAALAEATAGIEARLAEAALALTGAVVHTPLPVPTVDAGAQRLALYDAEHDEAYLKLIQPAFDADKHLELRSAGAWIRRDRAEAALKGLPMPDPRDGSSFAGKTIVVTGAGPGSIALAMVRVLLGQGARVVITTSRFRRARFRSYAALYREVASAGAELHVVPCNQGSFQDIDAFATWLLDRWRPDALVPFGAVGESADLSSMGPRSLGTLRVLMLGVERLIARVADGLEARPGAGALALLPLSPNHGIFGGDGAYAESKAGLETLINKWHHERWGRQIAVVGAKIGWVRGTGLMGHNDDVAKHLDGIETFSQPEMAHSLLDLLRREPGGWSPVIADLTGGLGDAGPDLAARVAGIRADQRARRDAEQRRTALETSLRERTEAPVVADAQVEPAPLAQMQVPTPEDSELAQFAPMDHLDLSRLVAVVGYGEIGPWGSQRTRWAAEKDQQLGLEAIAELAWTMGLVTPAPDGDGWLETASGKPVADTDFAERFEAHIMEHSGIRVVDTELQGYDPRKALAYTDVHLDRDFTFEVSRREDAEAFRTADPDNTEVFEVDGVVNVRRKAGTSFKVRRALKLDRWAGGQVPSGWDPTRYGIPPEIVEQVDRATLFLLIATAEAFIQAGLEPEEIYAFLHPTRVASTQATGIGGMSKLRRLYQDFELGQERQGDVLQETLINVITGWVVQSYLGSYGEMRFPVGACATAAVSVAEGVDNIATDRADLVVCGGVDDWTQEGLIGFGDMGATASTAAMEARGIEPGELCRPNDRRRGGFVESQGAGAMILCRASLAVEAGLPVYGLIAYAATYGDGINRSVPAPGIGILGCMAETPGASVEGTEFAARRARVKALEAQAETLTETLGAEEAARVVSAGRAHHAHDFWKRDERIAPLRGALAVFGLGADDIAFVSKHDTSTAANDPNEARLHNELQRRLGRSPDRPLLAVSQKSLTGHSKGGAAAWQLNGVLQAMQEGIIPGNRHLEDVDDYAADLEHICFSERAIEAPRAALKAALVTSLGFGHIGGIVAVVHPFAFWRALSDEQREAYTARRDARIQVGTRRLRAVLAGRRPLITLRTERPFTGAPGSEEHRDHEASVLTDASARRPNGAATYDLSQTHDLTHPGGLV